MARRDKSVRSRYVAFVVEPPTAPRNAVEAGLRRVLSTLSRRDAARILFVRDGAGVVRVAHTDLAAVRSALGSPLAGAGAAGRPGARAGPARAAPAAVAGLTD
ncbi:MAG: hypothetical protein ACT4PT_08300, partial [Methanobacteriota archaeon]